MLHPEEVTRSTRALLRRVAALSWCGAIGVLAACGSFGGIPEESAADAAPGMEASVGVDVSVADGSVADVAADTRDAAPDGPCNGIASCTRFVFVTSDTYTGEDLGGSIAADSKCTNRAALAGAAGALRGRSHLPNHTGRRVDIEGTRRSGRVPLSARSGG